MPFSDVGDVADSGPTRLYTRVIGGLAARGISYLHLIEARARRLSRSDQLGRTAVRRLDISAVVSRTDDRIRRITAETAKDAFGRAYIASWVLPLRLARGAELNAPIDRRSTAAPSAAKPSGGRDEQQDHV